MKRLFLTKILLSSIIIISSARNIVDADSSLVESKIENKKQNNPLNSEVQFIDRFDLFVDSINNTLNDTLLHYDWITDDIHFRKFDFSKVSDTLMFSLNDSTDSFTPPVKGNVTSEFGRRRWRYHYGIDIDLNTGDTVLSAFAGKVRISTYSKTYGNVVVIRHNNGLETLYAHLSKRLVDVDSTLTTGTLIGLGGNTGRSYGSHLHFEVRYFDEAIDPRDIIAFEDFKTHCDTFALSECNFAYRDELKILNAIKYHKVRSGNTLGHIARKYGTSISTLCRLNGITKNKILQIGERLRVR